MNERKRRKIEEIKFPMDLILQIFPKVFHHILDFIPVLEWPILMRVSKSMKEHVKEKSHELKEIPELEGFPKTANSLEIQSQLYQWLKVHAPNLEALPHILERQVRSGHFPSLKRLSLFPHDYESDDPEYNPEYVLEVTRRAALLETLDIMLSYDHDDLNFNQGPNKNTVFSNLRMLIIYFPEYDAPTNLELILECCPVLEKLRLADDTPEILSGLQHQIQPTNHGFARFFDRLHELPNLQSLTVPRRLGSMLYDPPNSIPQLKFLIFDYETEDFEKEFIEWKDFFRGANSLEYVVMEEVSISAIQALSFSPNLRRLGIIWLNSTEEMKAIFQAAKLSHLTQLKAMLSLDDDDDETPTEEAIVEMTQSKLPNLKSLFLTFFSQNEFQDVYLNLPALKVLNLMMEDFAGSNTSTRFRFRFSQQLKASLKVLQIYCSDPCELCLDSLVVLIQGCHSLKNFEIGVDSSLKEAVLRKKLNSRFGSSERLNVHVYVGETNHFMPHFYKTSHVEKLIRLEEI